MVSVVQVSTGLYGNEEEGHPAWMGWAPEVGVDAQEGFLAQVSVDLVSRNRCTLARR